MIIYVYTPRYPKKNYRYLLGYLNLDGSEISFHEKEEAQNLFLYQDQKDYQKPQILIATGTALMVSRKKQDSGRDGFELIVIRGIRSQLSLEDHRFIEDQLQEIAKELDTFLKLVASDQNKKLPDSSDIIPFPYLDEKRLIIAKHFCEMPIIKAKGMMNRENLSRENLSRENLSRENLSRENLSSHENQESTLHDHPKNQWPTLLFNQLSCEKKSWLIFFLILLVLILAICLFLSKK
jgi:hypothetical protein